MLELEVTSICYLVAHWLNAVYIGKENYSSVIDDCILYLVNKKDLVYSNFCKKTMDFVGSKKRSQLSFRLISPWNYIISEGAFLFSYDCGFTWYLYATFLLQTFLDFCGFNFCHFWFTMVYNSILFSSPLVLLNNLNSCGFCFRIFLCVPTLTA